VIWSRPPAPPARRARFPRGRAEARKWIEQLLEVFEELHLEIEQITLLNDDAVLNELIEIGRGRGSGLPGEQRIWEIVGSRRA
jgi:hypothetical protein